MLKTVVTTSLSHRKKMEEIKSVFLTDDLVEVSSGEFDWQATQLRVTDPARLLVSKHYKETEWEPKQPAEPAVWAHFNQNILTQSII